MGTLLLIVGWCVIGATLTAWVLGKTEFPVRDKHGVLEFGVFPVMGVGTIFWPIVLLITLLFFPARWAYRKGAKKA